MSCRICTAAAIRQRPYARIEEAFNQYQRTALNAFQEVEQALAAEQ
ncbi:MAG: hypothetical protein WAV82_05620 [Methylobacter sp.]